jgi:hypothetical protein
MPVFLTTSFSSFATLSSWVQPACRIALLLVMAWQFEKKGDIYNILWVLVFAFATLNILGLIAKRFEPARTSLTFGETIAVMVVVVSIFLLGWEMLYLFKVFPIKLHPHEQ